MSVFIISVDVIGLTMLVRSTVGWVGCESTNIDEKPPAIGTDIRTSQVFFFNPYFLFKKIKLRLTDSGV